MFGINIKGTGQYLPELTVGNNMLSGIMDTSDEWILTRTGMSRRHYSDGEAAWEMGAFAAKKAVLKSGIDPKEIGLVITSTITHDFNTPSAACLIQNEIGTKGAAFDVGAACSGFIYALDTAKRFLQTDDNLKYALVVANERLSAITDFNDRSTAVLFGDGAAAFVVERSDKLYSSYLMSDGSGGKYLYAKKPAGTHPFYKGSRKNPSADFPMETGYVIQDGRAVYKFAVNALFESAQKAADSGGIGLDAIDWFIPHQANLRIIETAAKNMNIPLDKFIINIKETANTSGATIPIAFDSGVNDGRIKRGDKCCLVGFGAGLTSGAVVIEY